MDGLIQSKDGRVSVTGILHSLLSRQVKEGERKGSFNAEANPAYYFDYSAPLALLAGYESNISTPSEKERYLLAVKNWLKRARIEQNEDGTIPPYSNLADKRKPTDAEKAEIKEKKLKKTEPIYESSAGVLWVAARYKQIIEQREDKKEWTELSDPELEKEIGIKAKPLLNSEGEAIADTNPLDTLVGRSLNALEAAQKQRQGARPKGDGLFASATNWMPTYYTSNANIHAALTSAMRAYDNPDNAFHKQAKTMEDKLVVGMRGFTPHKKEDKPAADMEEDEKHAYFMKGTEPTPNNHQHLKGHESIADGYASALLGKDSPYIDGLITELATGMRDDESKRVFFKTQTIPSGIIIGLQAAGYDSVTINGEVKTLTNLMEEQLRDAVSHGRYLHTAAFGVMTALQGHDWLPALPPQKKAAPVKEKGPEPIPDPAEPVDPMEEAMRQAGIPGHLRGAFSGNAPAAKFVAVKPVEKEPVGMAQPKTTLGV